jgi:hypothetical protein
MTLRSMQRGRESIKRLTSVGKASAQIRQHDLAMLRSAHERWSKFNLE